MKPPPMGGRAPRMNCQGLTTRAGATCVCSSSGQWSRWPWSDDNSLDLMSHPPGGTHHFDFYSDDPVMVEPKVHMHTAEEQGGSQRPHGLGSGWRVLL